MRQANRLVFDSRQQMFVTHYKQSEMQYMPVIKDKYFQEEKKKRKLWLSLFSLSKFIESSFSLQDIPSLENHI